MRRFFQAAQPRRRLLRSRFSMPIQDLHRGSPGPRGKPRDLGNVAEFTANHCPAVGCVRFREEIHHAHNMRITGGPAHRRHRFAHIKPHSVGGFLRNPHCWHPNHSPANCPARRDCMGRGVRLWLLTLASGARPLTGQTRRDREGAVRPGNASTAAMHLFRYYNYMYKFFKCGTRKNRNKLHKSSVIFWSAGTRSRFSFIRHNARRHGTGSPVHNPSVQNHHICPPGRVRPILAYRRALRSLTPASIMDLAPYLSSLNS